MIDSDYGTLNVPYTVLLLVFADPVREDFDEWSAEYRQKPIGHISLGEQDPSLEHQGNTAGPSFHA